MFQLKPLVVLLLATFASATPLNARTDDHGPKCVPRNGKCWKDVKGLEWTVHGFDFHASYTFTNPAHQNSWGYVNFNLTNNVVPYTAVCEAASSQLTDFFYGTVDYTCKLPADAPEGASVKFRFSRPSGRLDITESIVCSEKNAKYENPYAFLPQPQPRRGSSHNDFFLPLGNHAMCDDSAANCLIRARKTFVATGGNDFTLTCTDTTTVTPDWKPGMIYSQRIIKCTPVDATFSPSQVVG